MINLTAKIDLFSGYNDNILQLLTSNFHGNNISAPIESLLGKQVNIDRDVFILGSSKLNGTAYFAPDKVDYFIGNKLSDASGRFISDYILSITVAKNNPIPAITIAFDTKNNGYPTLINVDGVYYENDDAIFTVALSDPNPDSQLPITYTIKFNNWNKSNSPVIVTGIYVDTTIEINRTNLISISRTISDRADLKLPSFGIISNVGEIEFNDINGEILEYAEQLVLVSGLRCVIYLNNTLNGKQEKIGEFTTEQWNYDNDNKVVTVSLKDDLEEWQNINVGSIYYDPRIIEENAFEWYYKYLWEITKTTHKMLSFDELDEATKKVLSNTYIRYPLLESDNLWKQWTKICEVCQLHIYREENGIVVCRYNGGN